MKIIILILSILSTSLVSAQTTVDYNYDNLNRLTKITYQDGGTVNYTYDKLGNRVSKTVSGVSLSVEEVNKQVSHTIVYPNPTEAILNFKVKQLKQLKEVYLYNMLGKKIMVKKVEKQNFTWSLKNLPTATYIITLVYDDNTKESKTIVKK